MASPRVELLRNADGDYEFRILNRKGAVIATSAAFDSRVRMRNALRAVLQMAPWEPVKDLTQQRPEPAPTRAAPKKAAEKRAQPAAKQTAKAPAAEKAPAGKAPTKKAGAKKSSAKKAGARRTGSKDGSSGASAS